MQIVAVVGLLCALCATSIQTDDVERERGASSNYGNDVCMCSPSLQCPSLDKTVATLVSMMNDGGRGGNSSGRCLKCEEEVNSLRTLTAQLSAHQQVLEDRIRTHDTTIQQSRSDLVIANHEITHLKSQLNGTWTKLMELETAVRESRNIKEYTWSALNLETDSGTIKTVSFTKKKESSALKLTWNGDLRVIKTSGDCNRWYFKLNGQECASPAPIDGAIYVDIPLNMHRPSSIEGICRNIPAGDVQVEFAVGACHAHGLANAYTCWNSICRIMIEEM